MNRRIFAIGAALLVVIVGVGVVFASTRPQPPIRIGVLHSLTGTMAFSEAAVVDAALLAVEEINAAGGVLGRQIEPLVVDGESDWARFAAEAENLITGAQVDVVFGCWTSACRKTVKPVFEEHDHLLIYPVQYEGLETSPNIVYTGSAPNQQIIPAVAWALRNLGARVYLVGSDYIFPRTANAIINNEVYALGGEVVGEKYLLLGSTDVSEIIADIQAEQPDVILNTINGDSNIAFFNGLREAGITPQDIPTLSFSITENELAGMQADFAGDYAAATYFQSLQRPANEAFVSAFKARYGAERVIGEAMEAAYFGVYLWAHAVESAGTSNVREVREAIATQSLDAPQGVVYVDPENQHTWKVVRIGQIRGDGQFDIVWETSVPIRPEPYPAFRSPDEWDGFLLALYDGWGGQWANPGSAADGD